MDRDREPPNSPFRPITEASLSDNSTDNKTRADPVKTTLGLLPMIALSAALTSPAHAQNVTELDTINVEGGTQGTASGYKRDRIQSKKATAELKNTPQTVTVVPEQVIEERGASDLTEVLRNTPGISFDAGENGFAAGGDQIFIRGMNAVGSIFTDGSRDNGGRTRDTFNTEQVEVVKGVASANGRGVGAGYVNMVTKTPTLEDFVRGSTRVGFDDEGRTRTRGAVDVNKVVDNFAFRFNGMAEGGDIFGRDFSDADTWGVAPSLAYGLGTDFRAIFAYEHTQSSGLPDSGVVINRPYGVRIDSRIGRQDPFANGLRDPDGTAPRDAFFGDPDGYDETKSDSLLARFEYDATDWLTISNQTRWSRVDRDAHYRAAGSFNPTLVPVNYAGSARQYLDRVNTTLTNQTNLTAEFDTGSFSHTLSAGLEFSSEKADVFRPAWVSGNAPIAGSVVNLAGSQNTEFDVRTAAAYVYDTVKLSDQWLVNGGLRVERYSVDITNLNAATGLPVNIPNVGAGTYSDSHTSLGGQLGVVYKPRPEGSLYASYGLSHLPHGSLLSNPDPSRTSDNGFPGFVAGAKPIEAHNYELGVKWDFLGGDLSVTGALFRTEKHKVGYWSSPLNRPVYGKQIVQGVELGVAGNITSAWNVFGGVVFLKSERKHGIDVDDAVRGGGGGNDYDGAATTNGDELAFTPKVTANLWTTYDVTEKLTLGGGFQYVGESWIGRPDDATRVIKNGVYGKLPGYFLVNLMASYAVNDNVTLRFNVDNVFNETYLTTANWNGNWGYLGAPRTYRFGTSFRF